MTGKRKAKQLVVPDIAEDAAERKRVLNILAQRRYRQRRKDRLHALESRAKSPSGHAVGSGHEASSASSSSSVSVDVFDSIYQVLSGQETQEPNVQLFTDQNEEFILPQITSSDPFLELVSNTASQPETGLSPTTGDPFWPPFGFWPNVDMQFSVDRNHTERPSNPNASTNSNNKFDISTALQTSETSSFSFPDDRTLEVPSLTLLNAATKVAFRLKLAHLIWDLTAISPFYLSRESTNSVTSLPSLGDSSDSTSPLTSTPVDPDPNPDNYPNAETNSNNLPPHLQPTPTQRLIPHHPMFDLLPWPGTRDKFIQVFNLPEHLRPKNAQDPMGLMRLVYDMEDISGEGIKVQNGDPFEAGGWEIGQVVFERWWWAFEVEVVESSNRKRKGRGDRVLCLG